MSRRGSQPVPAGAKAGGATIAFGLLLDFVEHTMPTAGSATGTTLDQHLAHLVVLLGMLLVLAGIVVDGVRHGGRIDRPEGDARHALR